ncbi:MAG: hypothetical protein ACE5H9_21110, partial [Anaerolineae bacterium]
AISTNPLTYPEAIASTAYNPGTYYLVVMSSDGSSSDQPYSLDLDITPQPKLTCSWSPNFSFFGSPPANYVKGDSVLILWNYSRMAQTYGLTATNALSANLVALADSVAGTVISVESDFGVSAAYLAWETEYCDIDKANAVAAAIKNNVISPTLTANTRHLVLVGSDEVLPFYRSPDRTTIANEREFATSSQLQTSAILASMQQGFLLTDNFYGVQGRGLLGRGLSLWVPDLAVGRLVESPDDIATLINAYLNRPVIAIDDVLVTGYDFLTDSAKLIEQTVTSWGLTPDTLIGETWTVTDLDNGWTSYSNPDGRDLVSVNAHFEPWRALPASPSVGYTSTHLFYNFHITGSTNLTDSLTFSMGCHSGLNLPDDDVTPVFTDSLGNPFQVNPDFPQALAQKGGCMVANTGYGYGVDDSPEYSEWLMHLFARFLGSQPNMPVGEALRLAKKHYLGTAPSGGISVYHEKVLLEATLYGLPMLQVNVPSPQPVHNNAITATFGSGSAPLHAASVAQLMSQPVSVTFQPTLESTSSGSYYSLDGEIQASPGRPVQPRGSISLQPGSGLSGLNAHGAVLLSATFTDITDFNPLITRPVTDVTLPEPDLDIGGWFPQKPWAVNRFGEEDRLVIVAGQFKGNLSDQLGTQRLYSAAQLEVYYSDQTDDYLPPTIWDVVAYEANGLHFRVDASDDAGIAAVVVGYLVSGQNQWQSLELADADGDGVWTGSLTGADQDISYFVQVVDGAGNVQVSGNKGAFYEGEVLSIYLPLIAKQQ